MSSSWSNSVYPGKIWNEQRLAEHAVREIDTQRVRGSVRRTIQNGSNDVRLHTEVTAWTANGKICSFHIKLLLNPLNLKWKKWKKRGHFVRNVNLRRGRQNIRRT